MAAFNQVANIFAAHIPSYKVYMQLNPAKKKNLADENVNIYDVFVTIFCLFSLESTFSEADIPVEPLDICALSPAEQLSSREDDLDLHPQILET